MAYSDGPKIVTNGLVLALDAADKNSYPGSGTNWVDLITNNTANLTNGPTFGSTNSGIITFDGTNDYAEIATRNISLEFQPTQPYSVFTWFRITSITSQTIVANMDNTTGTYPGWDLWFNDASTIAMHLISSWSTNAIKIAVDFNYSSYLNKWINFGYTYNGSCPTTSVSSLSSVNFYFNGALYESGKVMASGTDGFNTSSETITYTSNQRFRVASRWASGAVSSPSSITIPKVDVYNRVLSSQEILQNYNAQKSRFGL
jgi:hypothetical protein